MYALNKTFNASCLSDCNDITTDVRAVVDVTIDVTTDARAAVDVTNDTMPAPRLGGILSKSMFRLAEDALDCGGRPLLFFLGAPTNLLNMIVFFRQGLRDRMNLCLFSLAFVDLLYLTANFILATYCFVPGDLMLRERWKFLVRQYAVNAVFGSSHSSGCLTMIIAVERCVCVVFPMKAANIMKTRTMAVLIVFSVVTIQSLCLVYRLKYGVGVNDENEATLTASYIYITHQVILDVIENIVISSITFVNFIIVTLATCITVIRLKSAMAWRQNTGTATSAERRQMTLVKMLVMLSCIYIICTTPTLCLALARLLEPEFWPHRRYRKLFYVTHIGATVILMVNSSVNFFVYITQSSRFRVELRALLFGKQTKGGKPASASAPVHSQHASQSTVASA